MLASFSELFDVLLIIAGLVLVITGLVMFIRSKSSTDASSVEAFGIKLNVTHPSLILVLAGVGLMLAPRLLPELPGKTDKPAPAVVAEAPQSAELPAPTLPGPAPSTPVPSPPASATPSVQPAQSPTPPSAPDKPAIVSPRPAARPVSKPAVTKTPVPKPAPPAIKKPQVASSHVPPASEPTVRPAPSISPAPAISPTPAPPTPAASKPARPIIAYAALGLPTNRGFWSGETRTSYTSRLHTSLKQAGRDVLRMDAQGLDLGQAAFEDWWNESGQHPRSREYCAASSAPRALLASRVETPFTVSSIESAFWPELKLRLYVCASQRVYRQQKTLSPQSGDAWPFATELNSEIERFMRTYRGDLAE